MAENPLPLRKRVWSLIRPYWKSEERWMARLLLTVVIGLSLAQVYLKVLFNTWNNDFYNSLQNVDKAAFIHSIIRFCYLAATAILIGVYTSYFARMLRIKWRRWLTVYYLQNWLDKQNYYRIQMFGQGFDNPDQRIAEDIDLFIMITLDLSLGALSSVVTLFSFLAILWQLSGSLDFAMRGFNVHIPGYMVWVAILYALLGTWFTFYIGRPLIALSYLKQKYEANFRFGLVRVRENSESIAFYKGENQEKFWLSERLNTIVGNWWEIIKRQKKLGWFTSGYAQIALIFPYVVVAPRFFSGQMKLGGMMQTASAFGEVQGALSYLIDAFGSDPIVSLANWKAVTDRLNGFNASIAVAEAQHKPLSGLARRTGSGNTLSAKGLSIQLPDGRLLLGPMDLTLKAGDWLLITGRSGSGKSTLLRALSGIWPFAQGILEIPEQARFLFVPQKPYLPLGTLAEALCYPSAVIQALPDLEAMLTLCRLPHLDHRLEETDQWSNILSLGEQQRVAFARVLLTKPDFVFLDEATSALDEDTEAYLYGLLKEHLPGSAIASVGHRASLSRWHASTMTLGTD